MSIFIVHSGHPCKPFLTCWFEEHFNVLYYEKSKLSRTNIQISFNIILPSVCRSPKWPLPFRLSNLIFVIIFHPFYAWYILCRTHPPWFAYPTNIQGEENKLLIFSLHTQISPTSCYLLPLRFKYSLQQNSAERSVVLWLYRPLLNIQKCKEMLW